MCLNVVVMAKEFFEKWGVGKVCEVAVHFGGVRISKRQLGTGGMVLGTPEWVKGWEDISRVLKHSWQVALGEGGICTRWSCNISAGADMTKQPDLDVRQGITA